MNSAGKFVRTLVLPVATGMSLGGCNDDEGPPDHQSTETGVTPDPPETQAPPEARISWEQTRSDADQEVIRAAAMAPDGTVFVVGETWAEYPSRDDVTWIWAIEPGSEDPQSRTLLGGKVTVYSIVARQNDLVISGDDDDPYTEPMLWRLDRDLEVLGSSVMPWRANLALRPSGDIVATGRPPDINDRADTVVVAGIQENLQLGELETIVGSGDSVWARAIVATDDTVFVGLEHGFARHTLVGESRVSLAARGDEQWDEPLPLAGMASIRLTSLSLADGALFACGMATPETPDWRVWCARHDSAWGWVWVEQWRSKPTPWLRGAVFADGTIWPAGDDLGYPAPGWILAWSANGVRHDPLRLDAVASVGGIIERSGRIAVFGHRDRRTDGSHRPIWAAGWQP